MPRVLSFHPVDPGFFETLIEPLVRGEKVNPEIFLESALRMRRAAWITRRYRVAIENLLEQLEPPPPLDDGSVWDRVRSRLERFDYKVPPMASAVRDKIDPDLTLHGRPFLVTERAVDRVAAVVADFADTSDEDAMTALVLDQLRRADPGFVHGIAPVDLEEPSRDGLYRDTLLRELREIYDWARGLREGASVATIAPRSRKRSAGSIPWRIVHLHSRAVPFWIATDVDGLDSLCKAAGLEPPSCLGTVADLFQGLRDALPEEKAPLRPGAASNTWLGAYVVPDRVPELLAFLGDHGARIIQAASRDGDGSRCSNVLRKIRECARFAEQFGVGYLEAGGIYPLLEEPDEVAAPDPSALVPA